MDKDQHCPYPTTDKLCECREISYASKGNSYSLPDCHMFEIMGTSYNHSALSKYVISMCDPCIRASDTVGSTPWAAHASSLHAPVTTPASANTSSSSPSHSSSSGSSSSSEDYSSSRSRPSLTPAETAELEGLQAAMVAGFWRILKDPSCAPCLPVTQQMLQSPGGELLQAWLANASDVTSDSGDTSDSGSSSTAEGLRSKYSRAKEGPASRDETPGGRAPEGLGFFTEFVAADVDGQLLLELQLPQEQLLVLLEGLTVDLHDAYVPHILEASQHHQHHYHHQQQQQQQQQPPQQQVHQQEPPEQDGIIGRLPLTTALVTRMLSCPLGVLPASVLSQVYCLGVMGRLGVVGQLLDLIRPVRETLARDQVRGSAGDRGEERHGEEGKRASYEIGVNARGEGGKRGRGGVGGGGGGGYFLLEPSNVLLSERSNVRPKRGREGRWTCSAMELAASCGAVISIRSKVGKWRAPKQSSLGLETGLRAKGKR